MSELTEITQKVYDLLKENGVQKKEMLQVLYRISSELESEMWETIIISPMMFDSLKDIIWYNLEHLPQGGETKGLSDLRYLSTLYPHFIFAANESPLLGLEYVKKLYIEIDNIIKAWDGKWRFAGLFTKSSAGWHGGDDPSKLIIYDKGESPSKYGYNQTYGSILGSNGKQIKKITEDIVLCTLDTEIGDYVNGQILYTTLVKLKEVCKKAIQYNKDVMIEFEQAGF